MDTPEAPAEGTISTVRRGALLLVGINRPPRRNGFTPRMFRELAEAYTLLDDDPELRVGVLHAHGAHFTTGLDLPTIAPFMQRAVEQGPLQKALAASDDFSRRRAGLRGEAGGAVQG